MKISLVLVIVTLFLIAGGASAQSSKTYKDGSVWTISMIKTKQGMKDDYLADLKTTWKAVHDEAVKQGLIISYKIISGTASSPEDWDLMLMQEYKDLATMEAGKDKWDVIEKKVVGSDEAMKTLMQSRVSKREMYGTKMMREVIFK